MVAGVELTYNTGASALQMANAIFGDGVTVVSANYTGDNDSSAIFSNGNTISPGVVPADTGVILSTGDADDFTSVGSQSNTSGSTTTNTSGPNGQADFNAIAGGSTFDASYIDVSFIPTGDTMTMQFVFASEEYPEYSNSQFNDIVGVWVNGSNVPLSVANEDTSVGGVNQNTNENLYVDNTSDQFNTEMDGFTVTLSLKMTVTPGALNTIRIGIADVADNQYDSNLLIAGDSLSTALVAQDDSMSLGLNGNRMIDVLENDVASSPGAVLSVTHINGVSVAPGDSVTLNTGQVISLNPDGTLQVVGDSDTEDFAFSYTIDDGLGHTDTAFVEASQAPCFVAGTLIETMDGPRPVEFLEEGDLIVTYDNGLQPLRWIGQRKVSARADLAPIRIAENALGTHPELKVSPQHRVLLRGSLAELLFGESEVLVAAKHLVNDHSVRPMPAETVTYVHLLFDEHQIVLSNGVPTESFLPGPTMTTSFERDMIDEITSIFPELCPVTGRGYGPAARRMLKQHEALVLARAKVAA